jgi:hypothetical protein
LKRGLDDSEVVVRAACTWAIQCIEATSATVA